MMMMMMMMSSCASRALHGTRSITLCPQCRQFSRSGPLSSGHNRWSTIKHDKGKNDMFKNKQHSILSQELMQASRRMYLQPHSFSTVVYLPINVESGADAQSSPRLAAAIARAKKGMVAPYYQSQAFCRKLS